MVKNLVIVESPAKAKTIEKFLGKDFMVKSCYGHIRDLASDDLSIDVERNFEPKYVIPEDKKEIVKELRKLAQEAELIWLATDEDREGEAISWHLLNALDLEEEKTRRIVFHEITEKAIKNAISTPRDVNKHLVDAQQARRILDRLVGFELSPILWRKIKPALSAGRVQSVAVRLIVEREREINNFKYQNFFKVQAEFTPLDGKGNPLKQKVKADLSEKLKDAEEAQEFLEECSRSAFSVFKIEKKPGKRSPSAPFTTSTLQQEASRKLNFSVSKTMLIAQKLYEAGHITYMRTDSVNLAEEAIASAENEIKKSFGEKYSKPRRFSTKSQSAQEAHEAIRPTNLGESQLNISRDEDRLYELIWKRTIASQMADAELERTNVKIKVSESRRQFTAIGEIIKFDGFLKVYIETSDEDKEDDLSKDLLPPLKENQDLRMEEIIATQRFTKPPARYTEASLVKKLEELGIGRPSTYAPTISTIQKRGYVEKGEQAGKDRNYRVLQLKDHDIKSLEKKEVYGQEKGKLFPSNTGMVVNDFLIDNFENVMNFNFTATVEKEFDEIANGRKEWRNMIDAFYGRFHPSVEETSKIKGKVTGERYLGDDPKTGKKVYVKIGKYGPYVQKGEGGEGMEKPEFAQLRKGQLLETITLDEGLSLFVLPRELGSFEDDTVVASIGRYGPYIKHKGQFYSIPKDKDPYSIELDEAVELIKEKGAAKKKQVIRTYQIDGKELKVLHGRYGPYIAFNGSNFKLPKELKNKVEKLTKEECEEVIANPENASKGRRKGKKK